MKLDKGDTITVVRDSRGRSEKLILRCAALRVLKGPDQGLDVEISHTPWLIGTHDSCDLVLADSTVSSRHAEVTLRPEGYHLKDLGSRNGVHIGQWRVDGLLLAPGMVITVGNTVLEVRDLHRSVTLEISPAEDFGGVVGRSAAMRQVFATLQSVARSSATVLFEGETGTGKEALAEALHKESPTAAGPFVVFDCGAVPHHLMESELFGHERGAFTGASERHIGALERAAGGTLFLDEIGEIRLELQPKLLRMVESRQFRRVGGGRHLSADVRIMAATHQNLPHLVRQGRFRQDLFYRLAVVRVHVPPLRERPEDLPLLLHHFSLALGQPDSVLDRFPGLLPLLQSYRWRGNVRELRNMVERLLVLPLDEALSSAIRGSEVGGVMLSYSDAKERAIGNFERAYVEDLLRRCQGNVTRAAKLAGLSRRYLARLMVKHRLDRERHLRGE